MCLIFTHHPDTILEDDWIEDFYNHNSDGIGVMYSEGGRLRVIKTIPRNAADAITFYKDHIKGRECVVHMRFATHGKVTEHNIHPYIVTGTEDDPTLAFMHNGVLDCGNAVRRDLSDTWHYNELYLKPLLDPEQGGYPALALKPEFAYILGDSIGSSNRFVFMDDTGAVSIVNEDTGVHWRGMWLANTYAWDAPSRLMVRAKAGEKLDPALDFADKPDPYVDSWADYGGWKGYSSKNGNGGYALPARLTGSASVTAAANSALTLVPDDYERQYGAVLRSSLTEIMNLLYDNHLKTAWRESTYDMMDEFVALNGEDALWELTYMCVDKACEEGDFVYWLSHPRGWAAARPPLHAPLNIGSGEDFESGEEAFASIVENPEWEAVDNEEVIAATLPRLGPALTGEGRPVYDCRQA